MKKALARKVRLNRETVRHLGDVEGGPANPQSFPISIPRSACCTASCHRIC
jgi:hypothetical protein